MIINEIFKDEAGRIRKEIENLPVEGCIFNFFNYAGADTTGADSFEKQFIRKLGNNVSKLLKNLRIAYVEGMSEEERKKHLLCLLSNGYSGDENIEWEFLADDLKDDMSNEKAYPIIVQYMKDTLEQILLERKETAIQREKRLAEDNIERAKDNIKHCQDIIKRNEEKLRGL